MNNKFFRNKGISLAGQQIYNLLISNKYTQQEVADELVISLRTVAAHVGRLKKAGLIRVVRRGREVNAYYEYGRDLK